MAHSAATTTRNQRTEPDQLAQDPHRPIYHYLPPANWLNDPNGLIHWNGQYHIFYQYNPHEALHANMHWGHAVSADLVHWEHLPIALTPTPGSPDEDGCWSGCAVDDNGVPTLIYSGHRDGAERACLATSHDELRTWEKYAGNPVIPSPPPELDLVAFRDHCVWKEEDSWYQIIGAGISGVGGTALLYTSRDLRQWQYLHPICVGDKDQTDPLWTGSMWECPDLFSLGNKHVLIVSVWDNRHIYYPIYFVGDYAAHTFSPEPPHKLDFGASFYAPQSLRDAQGRRLMWGWLREGRDVQVQRTAGWSGVMSLPRVLTMRADGMLSVEPAPELTTLRGKHTRWTDIDLASTSSNVLGDVQGDTLEIIAEFDPGDATEFGITVRCSPDGAEQTQISYDRIGQRLAVDPQRSSLGDHLYREVQSGPLDLASEEPLKLHIFLDRSVVEIFANSRACLTSRIYPSRADSLGIDLFARSGTVKLRAMDIWEMGSIWADKR
jgi:beta-fructofuranosidase